MGTMKIPDRHMRDSLYRALILEAFILPRTEPSRMSPRALEPEPINSPTKVTDSEDSVGS
jgi:hypothetical protein